MKLSPWRLGLQREQRPQTPHLRLISNQEIKTDERERVMKDEGGREDGE